MRARLAAAVSVVACKHGNVYVRLHDATGEVFAAAVMPTLTAGAFSEELAGAVKGAEDLLVDCEGHA